MPQRLLQCNNGYITKEKGGQPGVYRKINHQWNMIRSGAPPVRERRVSYIVASILSLVLIRLAIAFVYPKRARWDE
jgi:hypothetical protein